MLDSGRLGEVDLCPSHRGFPLQPLCPRCLQVCRSFALGSLASKSRFLQDFGELVRKGA